MTALEASQVNQRPHLTLGTCRLTTVGDTIEVEFMGHGSFTVGLQLFGNHRAGANAAFRFCRERGFRVLQ